MRNRLLRYLLYGMVCHMSAVLVIGVALLLIELTMREGSGAALFLLYYFLMTPVILVAGACAGLLAGWLGTGFVSLIIGALLAWTIGFGLGFSLGLAVTSAQAYSARLFYLVMAVVSLALSVAPVAVEAGVKRLLRRYPRK